MKNKYIDECHESKTRLMAVSGPFQIELMEYVVTNDYKYLIEISKTLVKDYGKIALLTPNTIQTYFNKKYVHKDIYQLLVTNLCVIR